LDGVVAKEHARLGLATGSSRYGAFLDAMCDKLVNCVTMFTEILFLEYRGTDEWIVLALVTVVIVQELALAIIRSQQYFSHKHYAIQATLAGKLKEKTESLAIVLLAIHPLYPDYILFPVILMLLLTISLAWQSLKQKIYSLAAVD
jgi:phosphatidylglycerophosphate synthase